MVWVAKIHRLTLLALPIALHFFPEDGRRTMSFVYRLLPLSQSRIFAQEDMLRLRRLEVARVGRLLQWATSLVGGEL